MKILYFHQHFSTPSGATGTRSYEMAQGLAQQGHEVTIVCGSYGMGDTGLHGDFKSGLRQGLVDKLNVIEIELPYSNSQNLLKRSSIFIQYAFRSIRLALSEQYDLVFATSTPLTVAIPGLAARLIRNKAFVFEVRDLWPELPKEMGVIRNPVVLALLSGLEWMAYRFADACIGLSPGIVQGIKRRAPQGKRIAMIPNGCDLDLFSAPERGTARFSRNSDSDIVAVFTGAHGAANGLDAILDAAVELQNHNRMDIQLVLIGDGKCKPDLIARSQTLGLKNIQFLNPIPKLELTALLADADVGLMILANVKAFYYGTSPNKFFDYIALGLPVVNNYPGWLAEMIEREDIGRVAAPEDPAALADALIQLADNPEATKRLGLRARAFAEREFNRSDLSAAFTAELEGVMASRKGQ